MKFSVVLEAVTAAFNKAVTEARSNYTNSTSSIVGDSNKVSTSTEAGFVELRAIGPSGFLVNASRGAVVDQVALFQALTERRIAGAGIDVFDPEPPEPGDPLCSLDNVIVTPHIAGLSIEAVRELSLSSAKQILDVVAGRRPPFLVNPETWPPAREGSVLGGDNA